MQVTVVVPSGNSSELQLELNNPKLGSAQDMPDAEDVQKSLLGEVHCTPSGWECEPVEFVIASNAAKGESQVGNQ